jgi:hypothetical protein
VGPSGVLAAGPVAATTDVGDVGGGPPGGVGSRSGSGHHRCWRRWWRAPGVLAAGSAAATTEVEDVDGRPLGVLAAGLAAATTEVEDVDGGPLGDAGGRSSSGHH